MKIIRGRLKPQKGTTYPFISIKSRIKHMILKSKGDIFDFVVDDEGKKSIKSFGPEDINTELVGKEIPIIDNDVVAKFNDNGTIDVIEGVKEEALPRASTVAQLKRLRKISKGTDIGDRISKLKGANLNHITNPIDTGVESYEDFERHNRKFIPGWNMKHLKSPFKNED